MEKETPIAKLRNQLTPLYALSGVVLLIDTPGIKEIALDMAKSASNSKDRINLLLEIEETSSKLTFKDLEPGDKFIAFPIPGDDEGHGGYKGGHVMYTKWTDPNYEGFHGPNTARRVSDNLYTQMPDSMEVIKIV
jgi:hypothetical protein